MEVLHKYRHGLYLIVSALLYIPCVLWLFPDVSDVFTGKRSIIYVGVLGLVLMIFDHYSFILKCRFIAERSERSTSNKFWTFFFIFYIFRVMVFAMFAMLAGKGLLSGRASDEHGVWFMVWESLRWLVYGFWAYYIIDSGNSDKRKAKLTPGKELVADTMQLIIGVVVSGAFFFSMSGDPDTLFGTTTGEIISNTIAFFVLYLMMHIPSFFLFHIDTISDNLTRRDRTKYWLGVLFSAGLMAATMYFFAG